MRILLIAMPDATNNFHRIIKVPNLGLCSIAANLKEHTVKVADLVLVHNNISRWLQDLLREFNPHLIGISSMSFQYDSAVKVMYLCRSHAPQAKICLGGYHASLDYHNLTKNPIQPFDFLIRGEGEESFAMLAGALEGKRELATVPGLSWIKNREFAHNQQGPRLKLHQLPLPDRSVRLIDNFTYFDRKLDCVETSRGCTLPCTFCSISGMYGSSFRCYPIKRVIDDLKDLKQQGVEAVLVVDDNITLATERMKQLCHNIIANKVNSMEYLVQASVAGIVGDPDLIPLMARANFRIVFLGIEAVKQKTLEGFQKGDIRERTELAVKQLRKHQIAVMGGFIIGSQDDTADDVREVFRAARRLKVDLPYVQCVTPYPGTKIRQELLKAGMVVSSELSRYTGFICNVRTRHLSSAQLNRLMNWENFKIFFSPRMFWDNYFIKKRQRGAVKVLLNNLDFIRGWFTGDQFRSRHRF